jgi:hypothetical protein
MGSRPSASPRKRPIKLKRQTDEYRKRRAGLGSGLIAFHKLSLFELCVSFALKSIELPREFLDMAKRTCRPCQLPFCHLFPFRHVVCGTLAALRIASSTPADERRFRSLRPLLVIKVARRIQWVKR